MHPIQVDESIELFARLGMQNLKSYIPKDEAVSRGYQQYSFFPYQVG
jgi:hypothetical protein